MSNNTSKDECVYQLPTCLLDFAQFFYFLLNFLTILEREIHPCSLSHLHIFFS